MRVGRLFRIFQMAVAALLAAALVHGAGAATEVLTNNYDGARTGANLTETRLNAGNVGPQSFGKLFHYDVDGAVFAQPLIATVAQDGGPARALVFIATLNNSVFAFDATDAQRSVWRRQLTRVPGEAGADPARLDAIANGIMSTPVIDRATNTIYLVASLSHAGAPKFVIHALDLLDGHDKAGSPVVIGGAVKAGGKAIVFEPSEARIAVQRAALALAQDKLIIAFGGDYFEGWVFAYDKSDLRRAPAAFCTTCASRVEALSNIDYLDARCIALGPGGGIWQAGRGPVIDQQGLVHFFTGNKQHVIKHGCPVAASTNACAICSTPGGCPCQGSRSSNVCRGHDACEAHQSDDPRMFDVNESMIQLDPSQGLRLTGWFRPANWNAAGVNGLELNDLDLGGSGPALVPGTSQLIGGGKQGVMYLLETKRAGASCAPSLSETCLPSEPLQSFQLAPIPPRPNEYHRHLLGGPVIWSREAVAIAYVWRENDHLRAYRLGKKFIDCDNDNPAPTTSQNCRSFAQSKAVIDRPPGAMLAISANGADPASAIVWASTNRDFKGPAKLMAFAAQPDPKTPGELTKLWDSDACEGDGIDQAADFAVPTVANGRVYLGTAANRVEVFGLIEARQCVPAPETDAAGPLMR